MATDRYGRVIVNPNIPLGMEDFARLYTANGLSPAQNASQLHLTAPTEGKSYLSSQWNRLGINQPPEQYFADAANVAAVLGTTPQRRAPVAAPSSPSAPVGPLMGIDPANPGFRSELERQIAIKAGWSAADRMDGISPMARTLVTLADKTRADEMAARQAYEVSMFPRSGARTEEELGRAQLAGDTHGVTKAILQSLQTTPGIVRPYQSRGDANGLPSDENLVSQLDRTIINSPVFQREYGRSPERAAFAYERLTGRSLKADLEADRKARSGRDKIGMSYAQNALQRGARIDPNTGKWQVWQNAEAEADPLTGAIGRPVTKLIEATPEQQNWLNTYYSNVTGKALPNIRPAAPANIQFARDLIEKLPNDIRGNVEASLARAETLKGRPLNPREQVAIIAKEEEMAASIPSTFDTVRMGYEGMSNYLLNRTGFAGGTPQAFPYERQLGTMTEEEIAAMYAANPNLE